MPFDYEAYQKKCNGMTTDELQREWENYTRQITTGATSTAISVLYAPFTAGLSLVNYGISAPRIHNARKKREIIVGSLQDRGEAPESRYRRKEDLPGQIPLTGSVTGEPYPYEKLDSDNFEIRVLNIRHGEPTGTTYSLEHISLIDPPPYCALSYCWGNSNECESMIIDDHAVAVTTSLSAALRTLPAMQFWPQGESRVWVDALCINQQNNDERSQQVRIMRQIYSKATRVLCWLGSEEDNTTNETDTINHHLDIKDATAIRFYSRLFSQPYWRRVWIIQEITVAFHVDFIYGKILIPWDDVANVMRTYKDMSPDVRAMVQPAIHLLDFRDRFMIERVPIGLLDALRWSRLTLSSDPRDKIFALLGLCHDGATFVPVPNYRQSLEAIITDMSKTMMKLNRSLDLICMKGIGPLVEESTLPTWVPNWIDMWSGGITDEVFQFQDWHASYKRNPVIDGSTNKALKVEGRQVAKVNGVSVGTKDQTKPKDTIPETSGGSNYQISTFRLPSELVQLESSSTDIIWKMLTMSLLPHQISAAVAQSCFSKLWNEEARISIREPTLVKWLDRYASFRFRDQTLCDWSTKPGVAGQYDTLKHTPGQWNLFVGALEQVIKTGMKLVTIKLWSILPESLAMVHPAVQDQDEIYYLRGCSIPVALRRKSTTDDTSSYLVVGGVYLPNMDDLPLNDSSSNFRNEEVELLKNCREWIKGGRDVDSFGPVREVLTLL